MEVKFLHFIKNGKMLKAVGCGKSCGYCSISHRKLYQKINSKITIVKEEMYSFQLNNLVSNFASAILGKLNNLLELQFLRL